MHSDDRAVDKFAEAMKAKLADKWAEGKEGWEDKVVCTGQKLSSMLREHVEKGDPVDVANFCMMLHQRGERIVVVQSFREETIQQNTATDNLRANQYELPRKPRSCNRHSDCDAAEEEVLQRNPGKMKKDIPYSFHCHDDECEDCFGC